MNVLIKDITAFEGNGHANGFEVECVINEQCYTLYMQLPHCPDSEHSMLNGEARFDYKHFKAVAEEVEKHFSPLDLAVMEYGIYDFISIPNDDGSYTVADLEDPSETSRFVRSDVYGQELYMLDE